MFPWSKKKKSASVAKDRLKIAIMTDKNSDTLPFMEDLKKDIIAVIKKYTNVKHIDIKKDSSSDIDAISIDVQLG